RAGTGPGLRLSPGRGPAGNPARLRRLRSWDADLLGRNATAAPAGRARRRPGTARRRGGGPGPGREGTAPGRSRLRSSSREDRTLVVHRRCAGPSAPAASPAVVVAVAGAFALERCDDFSTISEAAHGRSRRTAADRGDAAGLAAEAGGGL